MNIMFRSCFAPAQRKNYNCMTDISPNRAYNSGMPAHELNRENVEFTHNGHTFWIYTFMTSDGLLRYRVWRKLDEGQAKPGEARVDLVTRLKKQLNDL